MNIKQRLKWLLPSTIIFGPILVIPLISPDKWGPMVGYYYLAPVAPLLVFGPIAFLLLLILSMSQWIMVIWLEITKWAKPELDIDTIEIFKSRAAQYEKYLGRTIVVYIAMYFYYLPIAWYSGLDVATPQEAFEFAFDFIQPDGSDY